MALAITVLAVSLIGVTWMRNATSPQNEPIATVNQVDKF